MSAAGPRAAELTPHDVAKLEATRALFFNALTSSLRSGADSAVVTGVTIDCLAHLLATRPAEFHVGDLARIVQILTIRVAELHAVIPHRRPMH